MTWDELVFRPIDSDPFIYQGQAEKDWERRQRETEVFKPLVYEAIMRDQSGAQISFISESAGEYNPGDRDGSTVIAGPPRQDPLDPLPGGGPGKGGQLCYRPINGKNLWIRPPDACINSSVLAAIKCAGFTNIALGLTTSYFIQAKNAGLSPSDITLWITPCKLYDYAKEAIRQWCENDRSFEGFVEIMKQSLKAIVTNMNAFMGLRDKEQKAFRRIWFDEPESGANFGCEASCGESITHESSYLFGLIQNEWVQYLDVPLSQVRIMSAIFQALKQLRSDPLILPPFHGQTNGIPYVTEMVISQYDSTYMPLGAVYISGTNWISEYYGTADYIYSDKYGRRQFDADQTQEWNYPQVENGSLISLGDNAAGFHHPYPNTHYTELFHIANQRGWDTLGVFASHDRSGNDIPYTDCAAFLRELREFSEWARLSGWLERYVKF